MPCSLAAKVAVERTRDVFGRPGTAILAGTIMMSLLAIETIAMAWQVAAPVHLGAWLAMMLILQLGSLVFIRRFHARARSDDEVMRWGRLKVAQEAFHGYGWALAIPLVYQGGNEIALLAAVTTLGGLAAAIAPGLAVHVPSALAFLTASLIPAAVMLVIPSEAPIARYAALMLLAAYVLNLANALRWSGFYWEGIKLRLDMAASIDERRRLLHDAEAARRLVEAAAAERTRFFGAASHDLRQPVHALGLYASLLRTDPPRATRRELIANIAACVASLARLFDAILDLARPPDGAGAPPAFSVHDLVVTTVLKFRPDAARRGLALDAPASSAWARGDPASVERILGNLVSNAVRYTDTGGVVIRVRQAGGRTAISVADSGAGLDAAERERVFDPFYRLPRSGGEPAGLGLGLATVRELCRSHGYGLRVRSCPGRGSLFRLSLPAASSVTPPAENGDPAALAADLHVLLVEDDPYAADATARVIVAWGVPVRGCRDGTAATEIISRHSDARWHVLLDYRLDGPLNGLEIADHLRERHGNTLALTLITGEADPEVFAAAAARSMPVLRKPVSPLRLRALLAAPAAG